MKSDVFIETLKHEHAFDALVTFLDVNPIGNLLLDGGLKVVYLNKKVSSYFSGDFDETERQFGNIFKCENAYHEDAPCGSIKQCGNCSIRSSALKAQTDKQIVENVQVIKTFVGENVKKTHWFSMTFTPILLDSKDYVWVSITDLSAMMDYKVDKYLNQSALEDEILISKGNFHENVLNFLEKNIDKGACFGLFLVTCGVSSKERGTFERLWLNKQLESYHQMLIRKVDKKEIVGRYDANQYLIFIPSKNDEMLQKRLLMLKSELEAFEKQITFESYAFFTYKSLLVKSGVDVHRQSTNQLHVEYFKLLSTLENLNPNAHFQVEI